MNSSTETLSILAGKIAEIEIKLQKLEAEIDEIGQPAGHELKRRMEALNIEENALKRNLEEVLGMGPSGDTRLGKIEALLAHIEREESSLEHDAKFLHQSSQTSSELAVRAGTRLVELCLRALNRVLGNHRPLGHSVFVNHSHELLANRYGLADKKPGEGEDRGGGKGQG
jgi:chromosome segregation ATPase